MFNKNNLLVGISIFIIIFVLSGCANKKFEVIAPPVNNFPTPEIYEETEVIKADFFVEKNFRGNKQGNKLVVTSDAQTIKGFSVGEKGIISYQYKNSLYEFEAQLISCPQEGSGNFIAEASSDFSEIPEKFPGKFSVVIYHEKDAVIIPKNAVFLINENEAIVLQVDEKGTLVEKKIVVGRVNETHYQVIEGISVGEKVVLR